MPEKLKCQNRSSTVEFWSLLLILQQRICTALSALEKRAFFVCTLSSKAKQGEHFTAYVKSAGRDRQLKATPAKRLRNIKTPFSCLQISWNPANLTALSILYWQQQSDKNHLKSKTRRRKKTPLIHSHTNPYCLQKCKCFGAPSNSNILTSLFVFPEACKTLFSHIPLSVWPLWHHFYQNCP